MTSMSQDIRSCLCAAVIILLGGCAEESGPVAVAIEDPWFNALPMTIGESEIIPANAHHPVAEAKIAEAEKFLASEWISQISPGEVSYFAGQDITLHDVSRPYLVRGLYRTNRTFTIRIVGNALWVASHDDAHESAPLRHQPLVLVMDEVPETIYVTAGEHAASE